MIESHFFNIVIVLLISHPHMTQECAEEAQYMRIAKDYSEKPRIEILKSLFADFWKLDEPGFAFSFLSYIYLGSLLLARIFFLNYSTSLNPYQIG